MISDGITSLNNAFLFFYTTIMGWFKKIQINRRFEHAMTMRKINGQTPNKTWDIQEKTWAVLLGRIKDNVKNDKEIFIPNKEKTWTENL